MPNQNDVVKIYCFFFFRTKKWVKKTFFFLSHTNVVNQEEVDILFQKMSRQAQKMGIFDICIILASHMGLKNNEIQFITSNCELVPARELILKYFQSKFRIVVMYGKSICMNKSYTYSFWPISSHIIFNCGFGKNKKINPSLEVQYFKTGDQRYFLLI
jgi:hypothetical protein